MRERERTKDLKTEKLWKHFKEQVGFSTVVLSSWLLITITWGALKKLQCPGATPDQLNWGLVGPTRSVPVINYMLFPPGMMTSPPFQVHCSSQTHLL